MLRTAVLLSTITFPAHDEKLVAPRTLRESSISGHHFLPGDLDDSSRKIHTHTSGIAIPSPGGSGFDGKSWRCRYFSIFYGSPSPHPYPIPAILIDR
jgi:hypothetical protein